jgi:hypothetical protein
MILAGLVRRDLLATQARQVLLAQLVLQIEDFMALQALQVLLAGLECFRIFQFLTRITSSSHLIYPLRLRPRVHIQWSQ